MDGGKTLIVALPRSPHVGRAHGRLSGYVVRGTDGHCVTGRACGGVAFKWIAFAIALRRFHWRALRATLSCALRMPCIPRGIHCIFIQYTLNARLSL